ncbi:MAG: SDR family NAD(P)-dependent oxidoreductase, partial [Candidatus Nanopelagicales bacterium]|nr:SDR family NAD(P)-dependent oxidoreductase [Candidatus Nanopelagicales bacterium]
ITDINQQRLADVGAELRAVGATTHEYVVDHSCAEAIDALARRFSADVGAVDVLCLNAGVAVSSEFLETSIEDWQWIVGLNLWGPVYMLQAFLPGMVERRTGHVMITASLAGLVGLPTTSAYSASKFAVVGLAESLRAELGPHNIGVSTLCPGIVKTNLLADGKVSLASQGVSADAANRMWQAIGESPESRCADAPGRSRHPKRPGTDRDVASLRADSVGHQAGSGREFQFDRSLRLDPAESNSRASAVAGVRAIQRGGLGAASRIDGHVW